MFQRPMLLIGPQHFARDLNGYLIIINNQYGLFHDGLPKLNLAYRLSQECNISAFQLSLPTLAGDSSPAITSRIWSRLSGLFKTASAPACRSLSVS